MKSREDKARERRLMEQLRKIDESTVLSPNLGLFHIPKERRTSRLCLIAVKMNGLLLAHVPRKSLTAEICLTAVSNFGGTINLIPEEMLTTEMYLAAVKNDHYVFSRVPEKELVPEICFVAAKADKGYLKLIPRMFKIRGMRELTLEEYERKVLKRFSIQELLTHSNAWFRERGQRLLIVSRT
jgi:hypothetical protein